MNPALNGSSAIRHFKHSDAIEIRDGITFDFYTGLPHIVISNNSHIWLGGLCAGYKYRLCAKNTRGGVFAGHYGTSESLMPVMEYLYPGPPKGGGGGDRNTSLGAPKLFF